MTPYRPTIASNVAMTPNTVDNMAIIRSVMRIRSICSSTDRMSNTGRLASRPFTAIRMARNVYVRTDVHAAGKILLQIGSEDLPGNLIPQVAVHRVFGHSDDLD